MTGIKLESCTMLMKGHSLPMDEVEHLQLRTFLENMFKDGDLSKNW